MAFQYTKLIDFTQVATASSTLVYANSASQISFIGGIIVHNSALAARDLTLNSVPDNAGALGTVSASNQFLKISLSALDTVFLEIQPPLILNDTNDAIYGLASASGVNIQLNGNRNT